LISFPQTTPIDNVSKSNMLRNEGFFSVWIEDDNIFMSIFPSPEFKKLMIYDRRLDTYKIVLFGGI
jgi:hypothetical protein